eukprot:3680141-Pleurochrysis_carterae.AAC.2
MGRGAARMHSAIVQLSTRDDCSARRLRLADGDALSCSTTAPCQQLHAAMQVDNALTCTWHNSIQFNACGTPARVLAACALVPKNEHRAFVYTQATNSSMSSNRLQP